MPVRIRIRADAFDKYAAWLARFDPMFVMGRTQEDAARTLVLQVRSDIARRGLVFTGDLSRSVGYARRRYRGQDIVEVGLTPVNPHVARYHWPIMGARTEGERTRPHTPPFYRIEEWVRVKKGWLQTEYIDRFGKRRRRRTPRIFAYPLWMHIRKAGVRRHPIWESILRRISPYIAAGLRRSFAHYWQKFKPPERIESA